MKYPIWKPILIVLVLAACALLLWPPKERLKPGLDLAGGTTLIYDVRVPDDADSSRVIDDLINVLRDRVDPTGTRNLVWRQVAGNRIEIQMALASQAAKDRREAYLTARQELLDRNLSPGVVASALRLPADQRDAELQRLAGGNDDLLTQLRELATAHEAYVAATEPYQAAERALREARAALAALPADAPEAERTELQARIDSLQSEVIDRAGAFVAAKQAYEAAERDVLAANVSPAELERALAAPMQRVQRNKPARAEAIEALKTQYPERASEIERVAAAYAAYEEVKGPLDDPNDLIALLQGSGVLEFRIGAVPGELPDESTYRQQLRERGPRAGADRPWRWFPIDAVDQFADSARAEQALVEDPAGFFASQRLVGDAYGDEYYVLLANTPDRAMTRDQNWQLQTASRGFDSIGRNAVNFSLDAPGGDLMGAITGPNVNRPMAILLDGEVISAPNLNSKISGQGQITGSFSERELSYLLRTLKAGSSEAELSEYPISIKTTGPQLGQDNLQRGVYAATLALIVISVFMLVYYFALGLFADFAMIANVIIILGVMAMFEATFTLPGIAGIVLTIGMSVDANVLIFERIREELDRKADVATAVRLGFQKALSSIVDANVTTIITCVVLYYTATAEIKGFAITLMIGLVATLFTALFCTRVLVDLYLTVFKPKTLHMLPTVLPGLGRALTPNIDWLGKRWIFVPASLALLALGLGVTFYRGQEILDIEFRAGTQVSFTLDEGETLSIGEVRERLELFGELGEAIQEGRLNEANLSAEARAALPQVRELVEDARQRFEEQVAEAQRLRTEAPASAPDFGLLTEASVVTEGETQGMEATGFSVATLITDAQTVSDVVKTAFSDVLDVKRPIDFAGMDEAISTSEAVYPITGADLGQVLGRADVAVEIPDYVGGVAIVLRDLQPAATISDLSERITRIRQQPAYEGLGFRPFRVVGLDRADGPADGGEPLYASAVVVVRDSETNYEENPAALRESGGLAATEWALVRDALQRDTSLASVSNFSSQVSDTMRQQAIAALTLALLAIAVYIWFRFGSLRYSLGAIVALCHDVGVALGLVSISGWLYDTGFGHVFMIEPFKINLAMIAALLTIVGYSLNDTIIVFDRIRENRGRLAFATPQIINDSINQTLSRTFITSGTTLIATTILYIVGGPGVHGFAFAMTIGILVGTYSSIAVAAPIVMLGAKLASQRKASDAAGTGASAQPAA